MGKTSRERVTSATPTNSREKSVKFLSGNNRLPIWHEWDESSLVNEKWDVQKGGRGDRAARTPGMLFEDPDGLITLPPSLKVEVWKRPVEYLGEKVQTVVEDPEQSGKLNILTPNLHIFRRSKLIRAIITQISLLFQTETSCPAGLRIESNAPLGTADIWKPWHHLYPRSKPPNSVPMHSPSGKYAVKLFWMGSWRKMIVDDQIPYDSEGNSLLPQCSNDTELWLPILSKAIIKILSLDYQSHLAEYECDDTLVLHVLTGWKPQRLNIKNMNSEEIWNTIRDNIPEWVEDINDNISEKSGQSNSVFKPSVTREPVMVLGAYDIKFDGDKPVDVPKINARVGGTSFSGSPPPLLLLTESRKTAIPPPKPPKFTIPSEPGVLMKPVDALYQLRQQRQQRIKHENLLKQLAATSPQLLHATSAFAKFFSFEDVVGDYTPQPQIPKFPKKKEIEKKDVKRKETKKKDLKDGDKQEKKKDEKKKGQGQHEEKSEKPEKKKGDKSKKSPDVVTLPDGTSDNVTPIEEQNQEEEEEETSPLLSFWIDFDEFYSCFDTVYIFYKQSNYSCHRSVADMRNISPTSMVSQGVGGGRRTAGGQTVSSATQARGIPPQSPLPSGCGPQHLHSLIQGPSGDEQPPIIICIDNTTATEIFINFSSLSHWPGAPQIDNPLLSPISTPHHHRQLNVKQVIQYNIQPDGENMIICPGKLEITDYTWREMKCRMGTLLSMETTSSKCSKLTLAPGLHTLRLNVVAPYAWHVDLISNTGFVVADSESFVTHVNRESLRHQGTAMSFMKTMSELVALLEEPTALQEKVAEIAISDRNKTLDKTFVDVKFAFEAFFYTLDNSLSEHITQKHRDAWTGFATSVIRTYTKTMGNSVVGMLEQDPVPYKKYAEPGDHPDVKSDRHPAQAKAAASTIQRHFRGHHVRKRLSVIKKGTKQNQTTRELIKDTMSKVEGDELHKGLQVLNRLQHHDSNIFKWYSFHDDVPKYAYYVDYSASFGDVPARNWFLVFMEVFTVSQPTFALVQVTCPLTNIIVKVINNDTGDRMPNINGKPKPCHFLPNMRGYTIMGESKSYDGPVSGGKYRIRLVGSNPELLTPLRDISTGSIHTNEIRDYYLPERHNVIMRYVINVFCDLTATIQFSTSKPDVNFRVTLFDDDEVLHVVEGVGNVVIPCRWLYCDEVTTTSSAKGRRTPIKSRGAKATGAKSPGSKTPTTTTTTTRQTSHVLPHDPDATSKKSHHYVVQAVVLRNSWDNNSSPWQPIVEEYAGKEDANRPLSEAAVEEKPQTPNKKRGQKEDKPDKKAPKSKASPAFDETKPFWVLRVCYQSGNEEVVLKRDTQREDEIKAIKAAWEELQPGRAEKARAVREAYLADRAAKAEAIRAAAEAERIAAEQALNPAKSEEEESEEVRQKEEKEKLEKEKEVQEFEAAKKHKVKPGSARKVSPRRRYSGGSKTDFKHSHTPIIVLEPTEASEHGLIKPANTSKFYEIPEEFAPYVREHVGEPELLDEKLYALYLNQHKLKIEEFQIFRNQVLDGRNKDRIYRNEMKEKLLDDAERMHVELTERRAEVFAAREALRQKLIAEEATRLAALEPVAPADGSKPGSAKSKKAPKSAKGKKKK